MLAALRPFALDEYLSSTGNNKKSTSRAPKASTLARSSTCRGTRTGRNNMERRHTCPATSYRSNPSKRRIRNVLAAALSKKTLTPLRALHVPLSSESDATGYSYSESDD